MTGIAQIGSASIWQRRPRWIVHGTITRPEAEYLYRLVADLKPTRCVEVGTASGFSTAVLGAAIIDHALPCELITCDVLEDVYFDSSKRVGDACREMIGEHAWLTIASAQTATEVAASLRDKVVDLLFIDANHLSPWAALDLLAFIKLLDRHSTVVLHDVQLPLLSADHRNSNGPRDLYRSWLGPKYSPMENLGVLCCSGGRESIRESIVQALALPWDTGIDEKEHDQLKTLGKTLSPGSRSELDRALERYAACDVSVENANQYCRTTRYVFGFSQFLHPNDDSNLPVRFRARFPRKPSASALAIDALPFNIDQRNPGAYLTITARTVPGGETAGQTRGLARPRLVNHFTIDLPLMDSDGIEIEITVDKGSPPIFNYAGIEIFHFRWIE